jgi:hypothetical protein
VQRFLKLSFNVAAFLVIAGSAFVLAAAPPAKNPLNGAIGVNGRIPANAPANAPSITTPANGASVSTLPVRVAGLCKTSLLVEIFKNGVFSGSTQCAGGSYSLQIDLFSGKNDLAARAYDALNQASPDSNKVSVTFNDQVAESGPRVSLTSAYAKRGADPGTQLSWPLTISGGTAPYAVSADWGDGSSAELLSIKSTGDFIITHTYQVAGTYNVTVKATDAAGEAAFLQLVAVGNGTVQQTNAAASSSTGSTSQGGLSASQTKKAVIISAVTLVGMSAASFWLGRRHQMIALRGGKHF